MSIAPFLTDALIILFFFIAPLVLCIICIVDILRSRFEGYNKIIWLLAVILFPFLGALLYYLIGIKQKDKLNPLL